MIALTIRSRSHIFASPTIYQTYIGVGRELALILGGVNVTVYALSAFGSYAMIERLGRRKMFLWGTAGQALAMVLFFFNWLANIRC